MGKTLQWNINRGLSEKENVEFFITDLNPVIICLHESNFNYQYCTPIKNFCVIFKNRISVRKVRGGVAVYIRSNIIYTEILLNAGVYRWGLGWKVHTEVNI